MLLGRAERLYRSERILIDHLDLVLGGGAVDGDRVFGSLAGPGTVEEIVVRERSADQARVVVADVVAVPRRVLTVRL